MSINCRYFVSIFGSVLMALVLLAGCNSEGYQVAPVAGGVTLDGSPLAGVEVVFAPIGSKENNNPGPASMGLTDENGKYSLNIRGNGKSGAVVGNHRVAISYPEVSDSEIQDEIDRQVQKANASGVDISPGDIDRIANQTHKRLEGNFKRLSLTYNENTKLKFVVPKGGIDSANIDLKRDGS